MCGAIELEPGANQNVSVIGASPRFIVLPEAPARRGHGRERYDTHARGGTAGMTHGGHGRAHLADEIMPAPDFLFRPAGHGAYTSVQTPWSPDMLSLQVRKIGDSLSVTLPREAAARLKVREGDSLFLTESPDGGWRLSVCDAAVANKMAKAEAIMGRYRNALRVLAGRSSR